MRIRVRQERRKSVAYSLAPEELTIILPSEVSREEFNSLANTMSNAKVSPGSTGSITREELHELLAKWIDNVQARPNRVQVRSMRNKWASCSPEKNIVFNSILCSMPREFAEYVMCHELLHLKVPAHNKLFRSLLSAYMPDWRERIKRTMESILEKKIELGPVYQEQGQF